MAVNATLLDLQLFDQFRSATAPQFVGIVEREFWTVHALRAVQIYPALWHAAVAIAAAQRQLQKSADSHQASRLEQIVLQHYNSSVAYMRMAVQSHDGAYSNQAMLLMASILLSGLGSLRNDLYGTFLHAQNGIRLFYQWRFWQHQTRDAATLGYDDVLPANSIVALMDFIEFQFIIRCHLPWKPGYRDRELPLLEPCSAFRSLEQAQRELLPLKNDLMYRWALFLNCSEQQRQHPSADFRLFHRQQFSNWESKMKKFRKSPEFDKADAANLQRLELNAAAAKMQLSVDMTEPSLAWDSYETQLNSMLATARKLQSQLSKSEAALPSVESIFSMSAGEPLGLIGKTCRSRETRRELIALLRRWPCKEGFFGTSAVASICEARMLLEENGATADGWQEDCLCIADKFICRRHRIVLDKLWFQNDGSPVVKMETVGNVFDWKLDVTEVTSKASTGCGQARVPQAASQ